MRASERGVLWKCARCGEKATRGFRVAVTEFWPKVKLEINAEVIPLDGAMVDFEKSV